MTLAMWWLVLVATSVEISEIALGPDVSYKVIGRRGARPGALVVFDLRFDSNAAMAPAANHESAFANGNTELLYLGKKFARVTTAATGTNVISGLALKELSPRFGVCGNELYLGSLPRHCKRGKEGVQNCDLAAGGCPVSLHKTQHTGDCNTLASFGTLEIELSCDTIDIAGHPIDATKDGTTKLSLHQLKASWEFDSTTNKLTVWLPTDPIDLWEGMTTMAFLTLFLTVWQSWTRRLNYAVTSRDCDAINSIWDTLVWYSVLVADALFFAVAAKAYGLIRESRAFLPEAANEVLGEFAYIYNFAYLGLTTLAAVAAAVILWLMYFSRPDMVAWRTRRPRSQKKWWERRLNKAVARVCSPPARLSRVILLRWLVDAIVLTALHIAVPEALGERLRSSLGLTAGATVAVVTGRDSYLLFLEGLTVPSAILVVLAVLFIINHVAFFMLLETFSTAETAHPPLPVLLSYVIALQACGAGAVWAQGTRAPRGIAPGRDAQSAKVL